MAFFKKQDLIKIYAQIRRHIWFLCVFIEQSFYFFFFFFAPSDTALESKPVFVDCPTFQICLIVSSWCHLIILLYPLFSGSLVQKLDQAQVTHFFGKEVLLFLLFRAIPVAFGGSQARGGIGATVAGLWHSHSNTGSELHLQPTPQLVVMPDP